MAFVVEDGTGLESANSYASVEFADSYFSETGRTAQWGNDTPSKQIAAILATQYMDLIFGEFLIGYRAIKTPMQSLQFPRIEAYDSEGIEVTGVPLLWKKACCEYALIARTTPLIPVPSSDKSGNLLSEETTIVGPITKTKKYLGSGNNVIKSYPIPDSMVISFLRKSSFGRVVV